MKGHAQSQQILAKLLVLTFGCTSKFTPSPWYKGGGGGWMEPLAGVFDMLQFFDKMRYILWVVGLLDACDVTNNGPILAAILDFTKNWKSG